MTRAAKRRSLSLRELGDLAQRAWVATGAAFVLPSAALLLLGKESWAGASDDRVSAVMSTTYSGYLREVGGLTVLVGLTEWGLLSFATLGVLLLARQPMRKRIESPRGRDAATVFIALLVVAVYVGFGVQRHPGLFLEPLASSAALQVWVEACAYLAPVAALVVAAGYAVAMVRGELFAQVALIAVACVAGGGLGTAVKRSAKFAPTPFRAPAPSAGAKVSTVPPKAATPTRSPNVLWIAVDSLRPDRIDPKHTPRISALLGESVYFENAIVPVPRTGPSWAAALTSLAPMTNGIETMFPSRSASDLSKLALPAHLVSKGYRTLVTSEYAGAFFGRVDFGFQLGSIPRAELMEISGQILLARAPLVLSHFGLLYTSTPWVRSLLPAKLVELTRGMPNFSHPAVLADDVLAHLEAPAAQEQPFFALAFYSQPHFPYTSSPEFGKKYHVSGSSSSIRYGRDVANDTPITTDADRQQLDGLYRASLAESDAAIGELLDSLAKRGVLDDTIVVLSADHGEGLYDCAECVGHGDNLRSMTTLRVPLAFRLPNGRFPDAAPQVLSQYVSTLDVYPTLLSLLGWSPIAVHEGVALLTRKGRPATIPERTLFVETGEWLWTTAAVPKDRLVYPPITEIARLEDDRIAIDPKYEPVIRAAKHRAAIRAPYKLVYEPTADGARYRLFDFEKDPTDEHDLSASMPEIAARMKDELRKDVLRHAFVIPAGEHFLTRPPMPSDSHW
ncbi:MAG: sulfatase-like hydrolase/transferase [Myxococcales bacterium]|nr:sulfatase-like hydrolase/transferase [Myxococcales bacterium]